MAVSVCIKSKVSAVASRQELERAIDMLREGDKLVVTKLDRLPVT